MICVLSGDQLEGMVECGKKGKEKKKKLLKQKTLVSNCYQLSMRKTVSEMSTLHRFGPLEAGAGDLRTVALVTMWILASPCPLITAHFLNTKLGSVAKTKFTSVNYLKVVAFNSINIQCGVHFFVD
jgi:hypothetical protein